MSLIDICLSEYVEGFNIHKVRLVGDKKTISEHREEPQLYCLKPPYASSLKATDLGQWCWQVSHAMRCCRPINPDFSEVEGRPMSCEELARDIIIVYTIQAIHRSGASDVLKAPHSRASTLPMHLTISSAPDPGAYSAQGDPF